MKTAVVLSVAILANAFGNVCLSRGMQSFKPVGLSEGGWLGQAASHVVSNPWMIVGVLLLIIFLAAYMSALSWADLSFVLPATAPAYILTAILARFFLNESISPIRWAGTALIVVGTCIVARTLRDSGEQPASKAGTWPDFAGAAAGDRSQQEKTRQ